MKRLTLQEMNESQQRRVKTQLDQERKRLGRELTNAENNRIKDNAIDEIMKELEKAASAVRAEKKKNKLQPSQETFSWSANTHIRGRR